MPVAPGCPEPQQLRQFAREAISEVAEDRLARHLEHCPACAGQLDALLEDGWIPAALRAPGTLTPLPDDSRVEQLMGRLKGLATLVADEFFAADTPPRGHAVLDTPFRAGQPSTDSAAQEPSAEPSGTRSWSPEWAFAGEERPGTGAEAKPLAQSAGSYLGGYLIRGEVGRGGMGVVYRAWDEKLHRQVALKVLKPMLHSDETYRKRFANEARLAANLRPEYVAAVYAAGEERGTLFLAMEYLEGANLEDWLQAHPGPVAAGEVLRVARDVLCGLEAAHRKELVHRDIKPSNLWAEKDTGRIKVLDFGLARALSAADLRTPTGALLGTPGYLAPEQARGEPAMPRSDLFSLGVVLYRMVSGSCPFHRANIHASLIAVTQDEPPLLTGLPPRLSKFIARLMSKSPQGRPADATQALAELRQIEKDLTAAPPRRPRKAWLVATAAAAIVVGTLVIPQVIVIIRDDKGKVQARVEIKDALKNGGRVEVNDKSTGKKNVVRIGPQKEPPPAPAASEIRPGAAVVVTAYTRGYEDKSEDTAHFAVPFVDRGTRGTVLEIAPTNNRCRVRLETAPKEDVWLSLDLVRRR